MLFFYGASNVQKAGKLLQVDYPRISCLWGAEHIISLWFNDLAKTFHVKLLIRVYRHLYKWFGGSVHVLYALLQTTSAANNEYSAMSLCLLLASDVRMGGHFIAFICLARLKQSLLDAMVTSICAKSDFPAALKSIVQNDKFWDAIVLLCRAASPMLRVLRLADKKEPAMDKLVFFCHKGTDYMTKYAAKLDYLFIDQTSYGFESSVWQQMLDFVGKNKLSPEMEPQSIVMADVLA